MSTDYAEIPWTSPHLKAGTGYDPLERELKSSALDSFKFPCANPQGSREVLATTTIVEDQVALDNLIKESVSVAVPIDGVEVKVSASYLNKLKVSETEMCIIIEATMKDPDLQSEGPFALTTEARQYLESKGSKEFLAKYGDYFVYGFRSHAIFTATCQVRASTRETLDEFKNKISVGVTDVAKVSNELELAFKTTKSNISYQINIHVIGYSASGGILINTREILTSFEKFQQNASPIPYVALLRNYSTIDTAILPSDKDLAQSSTELTDAYHRAYMLQTRVISLPFVGANALADRISEVVKKLRNIKIDKEGWKNQVAQLMKEMDKPQEEYNKWTLRSRLLSDAKKLALPKIKPGNYVAGLDPVWERGIIINDTDPVFGVIASEVRRSLPRRFNPAAPPWVWNRNATSITLDDEYRIIVGFRITSVWGGDHNGSWNMISGNVGDNRLVVEFFSEEGRGCNWTAEIWTVDRILYELIP